MADFIIVLGPTFNSMCSANRFFFAKNRMMMRGWKWTQGSKLRFFFLGRKTRHASWVFLVVCLCDSSLGDEGGVDNDDNSNNDIVYEHNAFLLSATLILLPCGMQDCFVVLAPPAPSTRRARR